jgi:photosystem II stability/assembly factor-like uncharacterized protein
MAELPVLASSRALGLSRAERRAAKEIALTRAAGNVLAAREAAKIDAITSVGETAMLNAFELTCLESALVARNPAFAGRAAFIGDGACIGMRNVLTRMSRAL